MIFRLVVLTALMVSNNSFIDGSGQCPPCPAKKVNDQVVAGKCKNSGGGSSNYKKITLIDVTKSTGQDRCNDACQVEGDTCQGWAFRDDNDTDNCQLYSYKPDKVKSNKPDAAEWECYVKGTFIDFSFVGDGVCQGGGSKYAEERAYRGGEIDVQNPLGTIESIAQCAEFCTNNVDIEDYFFYEPGSTCKGFNFENDRCINSFGVTADRCSTNCYLYGEAPTGNRTRPSRKTNYDGRTCYARTTPGCSCD